MEGKNFENNSEQSIVNEVRAKRYFLYSIKEKVMEIHEKICDIAEELEKNIQKHQKRRGQENIIYFML